MLIVDLSHTIVTGMAQYPGDDPPPRLERKMTHAHDGVLSSAMTMGCHVGTHIDTPYHFLDDQPGLEALAVDRFCGRARVVEAIVNDDPGALGLDILEHVDLERLDFLILRTGWERHWGTEFYYARWPFLSPEFARTLTTAKLKGIGLDSPSVDAFDEHAVHDLLAAAGMINVENLANLHALPTGSFQFMALPLKLAGTEASPVRAVALL
jgi:kynurenine formamidase